MHSLFRVFCAVAAAWLAFAESSPSLAQASAADSTLTAIKDRGTLKVGWAPWFPYVYRDTAKNEVAGVSVDIMNEIAKELQVKLELVEDNWPTLIAGIQAKRFDTVVPMAITIPRAAAVTFSKPFLQHELGLAVPKKDLAKYTSFQDANKSGVRITVSMGSNGDLYATKAFPNAEMLRVKGGPDSVTQLLTGRADAWANSYDGFAMVLKDQPDLAVVPGPAFAASKVAFVVRQGDYIFRDWLDVFMEEFKATGGLLRVIEKGGMEKSQVVN